MRSERAEEGEGEREKTSGVPVKVDLKTKWGGGRGFGNLDLAVRGRRAGGRERANLMEGI